MSLANKYCRCDVCTRFYPGMRDWKNGIACDVCGRDDLKLISFVPTVVQEFLRISRLCEFCRNSIHAHVYRDWGLCFADSREDALKWSLVDWVRSRVWFDHWYANKYHGHGHYPPPGLCHQRRG